jgi:hypothetical protein
VRFSAKLCLLRYNIFKVFFFFFFLMISAVKIVYVHCRKFGLYFCFFVVNLMPVSLRFFF